MRWQPQSPSRCVHRAAAKPRHPHCLWIGCLLSVLTTSGLPYWAIPTSTALIAKGTKELTCATDAYLVTRLSLEAALPELPKGELRTFQCRTTPSANHGASVAFTSETRPASSSAFFSTSSRTRSARRIEMTRFPLMHSGGSGGTDFVAAISRYADCFSSSGQTYFAISVF